MLSMEYYSSLALIPLWILFGVFLTIFYKRNFTFRKHFGCRIGTLALFGLLWTLNFSFNKGVIFSPSVAGVTGVYVLNELFGEDLAKEEKVKSLVLATTLFLCTSLTGDVLACSAVFCAMTQLLRRPESLKNSLREVRIIFGPVYPILVTGASIQTGFNSNFLTLSWCVSLVAAIFLRPDNKEMLTVIEVAGLPVPSQKTRKLTHGFLMFTSLVCVVVHLMSSSSQLHRMVLAGTFVFGGLNVALYVCAAELPRNIFHNNNG